MPRSRTRSPGVSATSTSCKNSTAAKIGRALSQFAVGAVLCATMQIEQDAVSVLFGWLCVDSATAAHNISVRQSPVSHRKPRMRSVIGLDSF
jgi:hypothetical protein